MDEIVFDNRNKGYGAFQLRSISQKIMLKALAISVSVFVLGLYSPKVASQLGLFSNDDSDKADTISVVLLAPPSIKDEPEVEPPPPPPPPPEIKIERAQAKFVEMEAVKKEEAVDDPPKNDDLKDKDISNKNVDGNNEDSGPPPPNNTGTGPIVDDNKIYIDVDQQAEFKGGDKALSIFLSENLNYPEAEYLNGIVGRTVVSFVVSKDGKVSDVKVEQGSGTKALDEEALRVVRKTSGRFNAAKLNGKSVKSYCRIPIVFEIEEE
ncbi:MAG: energy transducer TonB [Bacteroidia bacterium]|nr:energy transducer TonB [Bacteroidia bacterium]